MSETVLEEFHAIVSGRVQGVGYRFFVRDQAKKLGIKGFVRNLFNGEVEVLAQGKRDDLEQFLKLLYKGPQMAWVQDIDLNWQSITEFYETFSITF
jgi:acylphosphatase